MKTKKLILGIAAMIGVGAFCAGSAYASNYYVRDGGGNPTQCTGTTNAVYSGSGTNQPCAFNNPRYAIGWDLNTPQAGKMSGGDTLFIDGDSDLSSGAQAQYMVGNDTTGGTTPTCGVYDKDCALANLPAGTSNSPTSIIGTGTHKPQLWGHLFPWWVISANNNYITLQWLEITDHDACAYNEPNSANQCTDSPNYNNEYPDGIELGGSNIILTDVYVHGFGRYGINVPDGVSSMGNATFTRLWVIGNGSGGFTTGVNNALTGTWTFNQPIIEWNGCVEAYPVVGGVDNPANYTQCFGQQSGGYGDGLAFGPNGHLTAGNWTITGPGSISFNTQDGFDTLHGAGNGTMQIDKMRFEGNAGQQVKINALNAYITNNLIIGDCGWWYGSSHIASGTMPPGDTCRAGGDTVLFNVTNGSTSEIYNNTIVSNGNVAMESEDLGATGCNSTTKIYADNNIVLAGYEWLDDTSWNSTGGNAQTTYIYNDGSDGNGAGTCGAITWNEDYNIVLGTKNNNQGCSGAHDKCGTNPGFASTVPMGTSGGPANTYYQGTSAATLLSLASSSPAVTAGVSGLTYWNGGNDYHNVTRTSPPSMGGLEANSCAANGYGCFYNSDCCAGSCSNLVCGTASTKPQPVVSITSPASGSNFTAGSNVTITAAASEASGSITNLSIYNGAVLLGSSSSSSYNFVMTNPAANTYTLTAVATDANGVSVTSSPVRLTIASQSILPSLPVISITSPASGSSFTAGSNITITTAASETNGTVSHISLYNGAGVLLGSSSTSPYSFVYANVLAGTYTFTAQVTDANGVSVTSSPVTVTVTGTPSAPVVAITSPALVSAFTTGSNITITATASETNGSIAQIAIYYNGSNLLGSGSTVPYSYTATDVGAGVYTVTAVATDSKGVSVTSTPVVVTVAAVPVLPSLPVVALTSPASGSSFTAGSSVTMTAAASETNGTISKVAFYNGSTLLGTDASSPYNFTWTNVAAGSYSLTAVATDAAGVAVFSSAASVTVKAAASLPVVALTSPTSGSSFTAGSSIAMTATASETNGTISKVAFYNGSTLLGTDTSSPYNFTWSNVVAGSYSLTAVATDAAGVAVFSSAVSVTVKAAASLPVVSLVSNSTSLTAPASIVLTATASETNGTISKVAFYNGSTLLGTDTSSPYSFTWSNVAAGSYSLTAVATDATGASVTSSAVSVTVKAAASLPVVSLVSNSTSLTAPASIVLTATASETNGTISKVAFYNGSTLLGTDTSSPYSFTWSNVAAGSYSLTAVATDATGASVTSSAVSVTVKAAASLPVVSLVSNSTSLTAPASIVLTATASETNGTISKVAFYNGSTLLGTDTSSPYSFTWSNVAAGYSLTAVATDATGVSAISSAIVVTVAAAPSLPVVSIVNLINGRAFTANSDITITATASEVNGSIAKIALYYNGTNLLGSSTTVPYSYTASSVAAGSYIITAVATDAKGVSVTSSPVTVVVAAPSPVVALTSPTSGSTAAAGSSIAMTATASEANGSIAQVTFYNGSNLLGTVKNSPYKYSWNNMEAGNYTIMAKATDANGVSVTSSSVTVTVMPGRSTTHR